MRQTNLMAVATALATVLSLGSAPAFSGGVRASDTAFQVRLGGFMPEGGGELWNGNEEVFNIKASDFDDFTLGLSYVTSFNNHFEVGFNAEFFDSTVLSEYRDFLDEDGFPILHDTELAIVPLSVDFRLLPFGRYRLRGHGRQVLQPAFYIGAGAGLSLWEYEEIGDFIDFDDPDQAIFPGRFRDDGAALAAHALAGVELPVGTNFNVMIEGRYTWADDEMGGDFPGFGKIELGGPSLSFGGAWRF